MNSENTNPPPFVGERLFLYRFIDSHIGGRLDGNPIEAEVTSVRRKLFSVVPVGANPLYLTRDFKLEDWGESEKGESCSFVFAYRSKEDRAAQFASEVKRQHKVAAAKEIERLARSWNLEKMDVEQLDSFLVLLREAEKRPDSPA